MALGCLWKISWRTIPCMNTPLDEPAPLRRLWSRPAFWLISAALLLLLLFLWQLFGPNPKIVVSPETTWITEPLRPDGLPDYSKWILERQRAGVTSENNAAVLMWQALGPEYLEPGQFAQIRKELGIDSMPSSEEFLQSAQQSATHKQFAL